MNFLINILIFASVLSILVFVHELGHLIAAKRFGVYCQEFAIGMGPQIYKIKKPHWETTYSIRALPFGGFVSMAGEPGEGDMGVPESRTMIGIARWKRLIIMLAGIFMNLVLAIVIYTGIFAVQGHVVVPEAKILTVVADSPAEKAGIQVNDLITKVSFSDGTTKEINHFSDLQVAFTVYKDQEVTLTIVRDGSQLDLPITPEFDAKNQTSVIGIQGPNATLEKVGIVESFKLSFTQIGKDVSQMIFLLTRVFRGIGFENLGGPIAIYGATSQVVTYGLSYYFNLLALLSINLAVVNLLPIPVMDGGRVVLTLIEMIIRRPIPEKIENAVMLASMALVLMFFIAVTFNDVIRSLPI